MLSAIAILRRTLRLSHLAFLLAFDLYATLTLTICPTPLPCHCISNHTVYCAFLRLDALPYFLEFRGVWLELDLSENFISHLPSGGLDGTKIRHLKINRNSIKSISADAFRGIEGLAVLDLSHNYLTDIADGIFAGLAELKTLRLQYNQLADVNAKAFVDIPHLLELDFQGNDMKVVPSEAIGVIRRLKRLNLRNNRLHGIHPFAFRRLSLELLDLGDNLSPLFIHRDAFCGLEPRVVSSEPGAIDWSGLNTLLLDHNGLTSINPCITRMIWTLEVVDVSGNPLRCDCEVLALKEFSSRASFPGAQCAEPTKMAGKYMSDLDHKVYKLSCQGYNKTDHLCWQPCFAPPSPLSYSGSAVSPHGPGNSRVTVIVATTFWSVAVCYFLNLPRSKVTIATAVATHVP